MKVEILEPKGYCAGVKHAIELAFKARKDNPNKEVFVLGMLVHNNFVVKELENANIKIIDDINEIPNESVIVFSAHGHNEALDSIARSKNLIIYDAICPKVLRNIQIIKNELSKGHQIIYIGKEGHPEANACLSLSKKVILYTKNILKDNYLLFDESPLIINQTTLNILEIKEIHKEILKVIPKARIANEICNATRLRQEAIKELDNQVDGIIVVGDKASSNTKRLLEIAKATHPNIESIMISDDSELRDKFLQNKNHIVISSGASTPEKIINVIYKRILDY